MTLSLQFIRHLYLHTLEFPSAHSANMHACIRAHLTPRCWWAVCKALPCADKQKISSDRSTSCCLLLGRKMGFHLQKHCKHFPSYVDVNVPLWSFPCEHCTLMQNVRNPSTLAPLSLQKLLCCILCREEVTAGLVIYIFRWWNIHLSERNLQLVPVNEAFVTIRLWYTLGEVQEGKSATH